MPRKPTCECGSCAKCKARTRARERYQAMSPEERRALVLARDPEKVRAADRARYRRDHAKRRAAADAYQRAHPEKMVAGNRRWRQRNPEKAKAHRAVNRALRKGTLTRGPCEREGPGCSGKIHGHHDDYSKPLEVRWLCVAHHAEVHVEASSAG